MTVTMEQASHSPSPFGTFDAMSLAPVHDIPQLTISPQQTTLKPTDTEEGTPDIVVEPPTHDDDNDNDDDDHDEEADEGDKDDEDKDVKQEEKKPVKKRKSWGQELPVPKTNLPPRKRAKTDDEKEQRRIERVLRNRAAAQTSRERKRLEVEKLESEKQTIERQNDFLLKRLAHFEAENTRLNKQVAKLSSEIHTSRGTTPQPPPAPSSVRSSESPTLTPVLFKQEREDLSLDKIPFPTPSAASSTLSPGLDASDLKDETSDLTQHPAAVLCDLQCQSEGSTTDPEASSRLPSSLATAATPPSKTFSLVLLAIMQHLFLTMTSAAYSTTILPLSHIFHSLKTGSPLTFSPDQISRHLPLILWLISTPTLSALSPTTASSSPRQTPVFRIRLLARLLECNPALARPLRDATSRALQLAARELTLSGSPSSSSTTRGSAVGGNGSDWALLMTVIWTIDRIEKRASTTTTSTSPTTKMTLLPKYDTTNTTTTRSSRVEKRTRRHRNRQTERAKYSLLKHLRSSRSGRMDS